MNSYFKISYNVLLKIFKDKAYSTIELNKALDSANQIDRALITRLVYGVLEKNIILEYYIKQFAPKKPEVEIYVILKLGAYTHLFMDSIPNYASVNELVNLTKEIGKFRQSGFVNAVLNKMVKEDLILPSESNFYEHISVKYSLPIWLVKRLKEDYGLKVLNQLLNAKSKKLKHIRINKNKIKIEDFISLLNKHNIENEKSIFENALLVNYRQIKDVKELNNLWVVQSLGSQFIVNSLEIENGSNILDLCSAPGGKTCYAAEINSEGKVTSTDLYEHRISLVKSYKNNMGLTNVKEKVLDATKFNKAYENKFDYVLVDAPCSGIGVISKKPDILLFKTPDSIKELNKIQKDILNNASKYVKVGGVLMYSTCTLIKSENIDIVNKFLKENKDFELVKINTNNLNNLNIKETITLLPDEFNNEGYFVAKMIRK